MVTDTTRPPVADRTDYNTLCHSQLAHSVTISHTLTDSKQRRRERERFKLLFTKNIEVVDEVTNADAVPACLQMPHNNIHEDLKQ